MVKWKYHKETDSYSFGVKDTNLILARNPITLIAIYKKGKITFTEIAGYDEGRIIKLCEGNRHTKESDLEMVCLGTEVKKLRASKEKFLSNNSLRKNEINRVRRITSLL